MDAVSYSLASKQAQRIEKFIENPDSDSGVLTQPKVIEAGETVTIKSGRQAILADTVVDGDLVIEAGGDVFVPAGAGFGDLESQISLKADTSYVDSKYSGFKNYIINGDMRVDQRNGGSQVIDSSGLSNYVLDRWQLITRVGATIISGRGESEYTKSSTGCTYYNQITINSQKTTASSDQFRLVQSIEAQNINDFKFGTVSAENITLSFWVNHSIAGTYSGTILGMNGGAYISYVFTYVQNTANYWEKKTINISGCQTGTWGIGNTNGLTVSFDYGSGSTFQTPTLNTWLSGVYLRSSSSLSPVSTNGAILKFTGVQLEKGSVDTPFEQRPIGLELSLCQRYYELGQLKCFINVAMTGMTIGNNFKVTKRIAPSMVTTGGFFQPTSYEEIGNEFFKAYRNTGNELAFYWSASAEL